MAEPGNCFRLNLIPVLLDRHWGQEHRLNKAAGPATTVASPERAMGNGAERGGLGPLGRLMMETAERVSPCPQDPPSTLEVTSQSLPAPYSRGVRLPCPRARSELPSNTPGDTCLPAPSQMHYRGQGPSAPAFLSCSYFSYCPERPWKKRKCFGAAETDLA